MAGEIRFVTRRRYSRRVSGDRPSRSIRRSHRSIMASTVVTLPVECFSDSTWETSFASAWSAVLTSGSFAA